MDTIELRAAASRLRRLHGRFAPLFGRQECQEHALGYLRRPAVDGKPQEHRADGAGVWRSVGG